MTLNAEFFIIRSMNAFPAFILSGIIAAMAVPASAQAAESLSLIHI